MKDNAQNALPGKGMARLLIVQPIVPSYRIDFFAKLNSALNQKLTVFAGKGGLPGMEDVEDFPWLHYAGRVRPIFFGIDWQSDVLGIELHSDDVLIVCGAPRSISTILPLIRARVLGVRTIWWGHYWSATTKTWRLELRKLLFHLADGLLFYTDIETDEFRMSVRRNSWKVIAGLNNGVRNEEISSLRLEYTPHLRKRSIFFIGRITKKAQIDILFRALGQDALKSEFIDIIGSGPELERLQRLASDLGISSRVRWHGALTDERLISRIANQCKLFCYPGEVGLSLIHAMNYGLPAVVHDERYKQMPEYSAFLESNAGWCFSRNNTSSLADVLSERLNDHDGLVEASYRAISTVTHSYNTSDMVFRTLKLLKSI